MVSIKVIQVMRSLTGSYWRNSYAVGSVSFFFLSTFIFSVLLCTCFFLLNKKNDYNASKSNEQYFSSPRIWYSSQDLVDMLGAKFFGTVKSLDMATKITVDPFSIDETTKNESFFYSVPVLISSEKLTGIALSSNQQQSYAVISNQEKQLTYNKGELIKGTRDRIIHILADRVIIDHQGTYRAIIFSKEKLTN